MQKYIRDKKQDEEDQQTSKSFDNLKRKSLQDNVIDIEYESLCKVFTEYVDEKKSNLFHKYEHKIKLNFL